METVSCLISFYDKIQVTMCLKGSLREEIESPSVFSPVFSISQSALSTRLDAFVLLDQRAKGS